MSKRTIKFSKESAFVTKAKYDKVTKELSVNLKGKNYVYVGLNDDLISQWKESESIGEFFNQNIKPNFSILKD